MSKKQQQRLLTTWDKEMQERQKLFADVRRLWLQDVSRLQICELLSISNDRLDALRRKLKLPRRKWGAPRNYVRLGERRPTRDEIVQGCARIQAKWSESERRKRHVGYQTQEPVHAMIVRAPDGYESNLCDLS